MTSMTELAVAVDSGDPATGLAAVAALRRLTEELEALHVSNARAQGWTWQAIPSAPGGRPQARTKEAPPAAGMTRLPTFAPPPRQTVIRAGLLASEGGATRLGDSYLLL